MLPYFIVTNSVSVVSFGVIVYCQFLNILFAVVTVLCDCCCLLFIQVADILKT